MAVDNKSTTANDKFLKMPMVCASHKNRLQTILKTYLHYIPEKLVDAFYTYQQGLRLKQDDFDTLIWDWNLSDKVYL